mgnify:FL=1
MKKGLLAGLCGLSLMAACVFANSNEIKPNVAGSSAAVKVRV